jgi:hypothetical protein
VLLLDLFCGRGGWSLPFIQRGWSCIGIDCQDHGYPGELRIQRLPADPASLLALAPDAVVASPPCEDYARHALPWIAAPAADETLLRWSLSLPAIFRCPVIVECSRFAARTNPGHVIVGPYALWGHVPALLPYVPFFKSKLSGTDPARRAMIHPALSDFIADYFTRKALPCVTATLS